MQCIKISALAHLDGYNHMTVKVTATVFEFRRYSVFTTQVNKPDQKLILEKKKSNIIICQ